MMYGNDKGLTYRAIQAAVVALTNENEKGEPIISIEGARLYTGHVNKYIQVSRVLLGLEDEVKWIEMLASNGMTIKDIRADTILSLLNFLVVMLEAPKYGIITKETEVNRQVDQARMQAGGSEELEKTLDARGLSMEEFRKGITACLVYDALFEKVVSSVEQPTEDEVFQYLKENRSVESSASKTEVPWGDLDATQQALLYAREKAFFDNWQAEKLKQVSIVPVEH